MKISVKFFFYLNSQLCWREKGRELTLTVKPDVLLMGTLQTSAATLVFDWQFESSKLQLAQATCSVHLVPRGKNSTRATKCFKCYFNISKTGLRVFFVDEPLTNYQDLLDRVKKAVPMFKGVDDHQIIISYKDLSLQTFINIDRDESLHVSEAFRNASPCGSDIYRRVYLKVRESDSPFLLKRRPDSKEASTESMSSTKQPKSLLSSFASTVNSERSAGLWARKQEATHLDQTAISDRDCGVSVGEAQDHRVLLWLLGQICWSPQLWADTDGHGQ